MFFQDLSSYSYCVRHPVVQVANIGWLEREQPFQTGAVDAMVCLLLEEYYEALRANKMRGIHGCSLCSCESSEPSIQVKGKRVLLGASELWVPGVAGRVFAAPDLIIHYLQSHSYRPPTEFITAVLSLPSTIIGWSGESVANKLLATGSK